MKHIITSILLSSAVCAANAYWEYDSELEQSIKNSEPLSPTPQTLNIKGRSIEAQLMNTDGIEFFGHSTTKVLNAIVVVGNKLVVADNEGVLYGFVIQEGNTTNLKVDASFGIDGKIDMRTTRLEMKRFGEDKIIVDCSRGVFLISDGNLIKQSGKLPLTSDSSGRWGIEIGNKSYVYEQDPTGINFERSLWIDNKDPQTQPDGYNFYNLTAATIKGDVIVLGGAFKEEGNKGQGVSCIDRNSKEIIFNVSSFDRESDSFFSFIHDIEPMPSGFSILDGNMRALTLITDSGEVRYRIKLSELFGLRYPWIRDSSADTSGHLYVITANDRKGEGKVAQGLIYRISGL